MSESSPLGGRDPSALEDVGAALKRESRELADEAKGAAIRMARDQRDALADYVAALADAAGRGADDLESSGYARSAAAVKRTAGEVGGLAQRLQGRDPDELWEDVEAFARDHPVMVFGAGFALAFGLARFLKSTPSSEAGEAAASSSYAAPPGAASR